MNGTAIVALGMTVLLVAGCSGTSGASSSGQPQRSDSSPDKRPSSPASAASKDEGVLRERPRVGTCWRVPASRVASPKYWYDDSPRVSCTGRHDAETVLVYDLSEPTVHEAVTYGSSCDNAARGYVRSDAGTWVPWASALFLPSKQQVRRGASWARCDVTSYADTSFGSGRSTRTGSVREAVNENPAAVWACLNEDERPGRHYKAIPFVDCRRPHLLEATGVLLHIGDLKGTYPSTRQRTDAELSCRRSLSGPERTDGTAVKSVWLPKVLRGTDLFGLCWRFRTDHELLPPMTGRASQ